MPINKNIQKSLSLLVKLAIVGFAFWYIYQQIFKKENIYDIVNHFKSIISNGDYSIFLLACLLILVNWGIEAFKWRYIIKKIEHISFLTAFKAVLAGATFSIFTPYRVGEYAGRILTLRKADRLEATLLTLVGNFSQMIVTLTVGLLSSIYYLREHTEFGQQLSTGTYIGLTLYIVFCVSVILFFFVNARLLSYGIYKLKFLGKYKKYGRAFSYFTSPELFKVFCFSLVRYATFTTQFYLLLLVFGIDIFFPEAVLMISMTFFALSIVPVVPIAEIGIRWAASIYFIGLVVQNVQKEINMAATSLWLINLIIPALIGCIFIFNLKFFKKD